jgi:hypothetical protein
MSAFPITVRMYSIAGRHYKYSTKCEPRRPGWVSTQQSWGERPPPTSIQTIITIHIVLAVYYAISRQEDDPP